MGLETIHKHLHDIYSDLEVNVTHIYKRHDVLLAVDLVSHSVLRFKFCGQWVQKGWVEGLIIGDTREGKSVTVKKILAHYKAGEFCEGESTSFAGLVGGIQRLGNKSSVTWGKIPLNDRRLVAIDEASGMPLEQISQFSGIRSSGVAQITKILTEKTLARTRLLWISNPRSGRRLATYNYGVLAVKELLGKAEDVSRLDFAITVASGEVDQRTINRGLDKKVEHIYTSDLCSSVVQWAWTRSGEDVEFTKEAEETVLDVAEELGNKYTAQVPLVQAAEQRIKVARLAVALACRTFSTPDGIKVIVLPEHVQYIGKWLDKIYAKPSMAYDSFSKATSIFTEMNVPASVMNDYLQKSEGTSLTEVLLQIPVIRRTQLEDMIGWTKDQSVDFIAWGIKKKMLTPTAKGLIKTPAFTESVLKRAKEIEDKEVAGKPNVLNELDEKQEVDDDDAPF